MRLNILLLPKFGVRISGSEVTMIKMIARSGRNRPTRHVHKLSLMFFLERCSFFYSCQIRSFDNHSQCIALLISIFAETWWQRIIPFACHYLSTLLLNGLSFTGSNCHKFRRLALTFQALMV